jgi:hypothetical protein
VELLCQVLVYEADRQRPFAHRRRAALRRAVPYVADREHPGQARLKEGWRPLERSSLGSGRLVTKLRLVFGEAA